MFTEDEKMKFQELMDCYYLSDEDNNRVVYDQLLKMMKKQNVTPVIGAVCPAGLIRSGAHC